MANTATDGTYIGYRLVIFLSVFAPLQVGLVVLRFLARRLTARPRGLDDWLVLAALFSQLVAVGMATGALVNGGIGYHSAYVAAQDPETITVFLKYLIAIASWYAFTNGLGKLAICVFFRTLFPQRIVLFILWFCAGIIICTSIATCIAELAGCIPLSASWGDLVDQGEHCIDKQKLYIWASFPSIITDLILLILPLSITWRLRATTRMKIVLTLTFFVGSIGLISTILRFVVFWGNDAFSDVTWSSVQLAIWTITEPGIYLIAACLMTFRPLLDRFGTKVRAHTTSRRSKSYGSSGGIRSGRSLGIPNASGRASIMPPAHLKSPDGSSSGGGGVDGDYGISLAKLRPSPRGNGFEVLRDAEEGLTPHTSASDRVEKPTSGIVKTVDINVDWEYERRE